MKFLFFVTSACILKTNVYLDGGFCVKDRVMTVSLSDIQSPKLPLSAKMRTFFIRKL